MMRHMRALNRYWETGVRRTNSSFLDIYPPVNDSVMKLPYPMNHYGKCDFFGGGLGAGGFLRRLHPAADTVSPEINFSSYQAFFCFTPVRRAERIWASGNLSADLSAVFIRFAGQVGSLTATFGVRA